MTGEPALCFDPNNSETTDSAKETALPCSDLRFSGGCKFCSVLLAFCLPLLELNSASLNSSVALDLVDSAGGLLNGLFTGCALI